VLKCLAIAVVNEVKTNKSLANMNFYYFVCDNT
jgi:hypothetical protein